MNSRERVAAALDFKRPGRVPRAESFWWETLEGFRAEGMPAEADPSDYFGLDVAKIYMDQTFALGERTIEETDEYRIFSDGYGFVQKDWKHGQATPELIEFAVKSREDWFSTYREMNAYRPERLRLEENRPLYEKARRAGRFVCLSMLGPFEQTWRKTGSVEQLVALAEDPEWMLDMYEADTQMRLAAFEAFFEAGLEFDGVWMYDDVAYRNGPLISPRMYREFVMPFHREVAEAVHARGGKLILHTCGNNNILVPLYIEAGVDCLQALEVKAGMDVRDLKREYGRELAFCGNIDARLFQENDLPGLEVEIRGKLEVACEGGGYIFHSDHSIPRGTHLATYSRALEISEEF